MGTLVEHVAHAFLSEPFRQQERLMKAPFRQEERLMKAPFRREERLEDAPLRREEREEDAPFRREERLMRQPFREIHIHKFSEMDTARQVTQRYLDKTRRSRAVKKAMSVVEDCSACGGTGRLWVAKTLQFRDDLCPSCHGT